MSHGKYEYTHSYLLAAQRAPLLSSFLPMIVSIYAHTEGFGDFATKLSVSLALLASALILYFFAPGKALIHGNKKYRYQVSAFYVFLVLFPFFLIDFVEYNPLAELIGWCLFAIGVATNILFHGYWYRADKLEPLGWYTKEKTGEPKSFRGSPTGNFFAIFLSIIIIYGAIALFGKIAIGIIRLN